MAVGDIRAQQEKYWRENVDKELAMPGSQNVAVDINQGNIDYSLSIVEYLPCLEPRKPLGSLSSNRPKIKADIENEDRIDPRLRSLSIVHPPAIELDSQSEDVSLDADAMNDADVEIADYLIGIITNGVEPSTTATEELENLDFIASIALEDYYAADLTDIIHVLADVFINAFARINVIRNGKAVKTKMCNDV